MDWIIPASPFAVVVVVDSVVVVAIVVVSVFTVTLIKPQATRPPAFLKWIEIVILQAYRVFDRIYPVVLLAGIPPIPKSSDIA